ncbi:MAG: porin [Aliishimia sp.]
MTSILHRSLSATALGGALAMLPALVSAQQTDDGFNVYGHLNLGVLTVDDGVSTDSIFTDNDNSNSRVGFTYDKTFETGNKLRFHFETAIGLTGSSGATASNDDFDIDPTRRDIRRVDLQYTVGNVGKFYIGQGSTATDGIAENDLSKTGVITYSSVQDLAGGNAFRLADGSVSNVRINQAFSAFDGGRRFRVRYDTPNFNGFTFSGSFGTEVLARNDDREFTDLAATYKGGFADFDFVAGLGYASINNGAETVAGSASIFHKPTGLNFTLAAGENLDTNADSLYVKAGIVRDWFSIGETALAIDYTRGRDFVSAGSESDSYAISAVQKIDNLNTEIFATFRTYEFSDTSGSSFQDIDTSFVGARWRF